MSTPTVTSITLNYSDGTTKTITPNTPMAEVMKEMRLSMPTQFAMLIMKRRQPTTARPTPPPKPSATIYPFRPVTVRGEECVK